MKFDSIIKRLFWDVNKNKSNSNYRKFVQKKSKYINITNYLLTRFNDSESTAESLQRIVFNIIDRPVCPVCGSKLEFVGKPNTVKGVFKKFCSQHCANSFNSNKSNLTKIDKYGDAGCSLKGKATKLERYGNENYNGDREVAKSKVNYKEVVNKTKQTKLERYGDENYNGDREVAKSKMNYEEIFKKVRETNLKRYGVEYVVQSKYFKDKSKQTNFKKFGVEYASQSKEVQNKIKQTCFKKYGVDNPAKSKVIQNKSKQTCIEKYGFECPSQSNEIKQKIHETKKKNGSYGKSKEEEYIYTVLVDIYGKDNVKRQYKSELYPFACDFYIITEDLYIEYNGIWTHGFTPYIGSEENQIKLNKWKQKAITSDYYKEAIITWTIADVKKRNTAKENKLNYIELWNLNEVKKYYNV